MKIIYEMKIIGCEMGNSKSKTGVRHLQVLNSLVVEISQPWIYT